MAAEAIEADHRLRDQLGAARDAAMIALGELHVVVGEAERAVAERDEQHRPHVGIAQIGPEQGRGGEREQDQHAAHRRRALLLDEVALRSVEADRLALALHRFQPADHRRAEHEAHQQRGQAGRARAEGDVAEQVEQEELVGQRPEQVVEHQRVSAMVSMRGDDELHPAAQTSLNQDRVAGLDGVGDDGRERRRIRGVGAPDGRRAPRRTGPASASRRRTAGRRRR